MSRRRAGYGAEFAESDLNARAARRRQLELVPQPRVTPEWLVEDRRDEALTCWPYRVGAR